MAMKLHRKIFRSIMRSYRFNLPNHDLPIRLRPVSVHFESFLPVSITVFTKWFLCATVFIMLSLAFLGFTNYSHAFLLNDKLLHFICLCLATGVFYFIFDVEEYVYYCHVLHGAKRSLGKLVESGSGDTPVLYLLG